MSIAEIARPEIRRLCAYEPADRLANTIRLNANEACWTDEVEHSEFSMNRYPEVRPIQLRSRLAEYYGVGDENLLVTRGSSEAIDLLIRAFCRAGQDDIVLTPPTFEMYRVYANIQGTGIVNVPRIANKQFAIDLNALLSSCTAKSKLIFVCSPNNPTGQLVPYSTISTLLESRQDQSIIVVDEAYIEFSDSRSMAELVHQYDNLVVLRTTSKALALAGTRCGCAIACREIIDILDRVLPPYSFSTPAVRHVMAALGPHRLALAKQNIASTISARIDLTRRLSELPIVDRVWPSDANFILVRFHDGEIVKRRSERAGILLRQFKLEAGLENCLRITVGSSDEIAALLAMLSDIRVNTDV